MSRPCPAPPAEPCRQAAELLILDARTVDPDARTVARRNVLVRDGRIAAFPATPPEEFDGRTLDADGRTLDADGRWLIPALTDLHAHSFGNVGIGGPYEPLGPAAAGRAALEAGVARYLDLFSDEETIFEARDRQRAAGLAGAEILAAGPCLTATDGHCSEYGVPPGSSTPPKRPGDRSRSWPGTSRMS